MKRLILSILLASSSAYSGECRMFESSDEGDLKNQLIQKGVSFTDHGTYLTVIPKAKTFSRLEKVAHLLKKWTGKDLALIIKTPYSASEISHIIVTNPQQLILIADASDAETAAALIVRAMHDED